MNLHLSIIALQNRNGCKPFVLPVSGLLMSRYAATCSSIAHESGR